MLSLLHTCTAQYLWQMHCQQQHHRSYLLLLQYYMRPVGLPATLEGTASTHRVSFLPPGIPCDVMPSSKTKAARHQGKKRSLQH